LKGLVIISAKPSIFVAGADLKSMSEKGPDEIKTLVELGQAVMTRLAACEFQPSPPFMALRSAVVTNSASLAITGSLG